MIVIDSITPTLIKYANMRDSSPSRSYLGGEKGIFVAQIHSNIGLYKVSRDQGGPKQESKYEMYLSKYDDSGGLQFTHFLGTS